MKDTEVLRRQLGELADETPEVSPQEWLAGTRHKVRVRRRLRVIGATGAVALALAAATAVVPQMMDNSAPTPVDPVPPPDGQAGWEFPEATETERVIASRVNDPGASEFVWLTKTESPANTMVIDFCRLAERPEAGRPRVRAMSTINGRPTSEGLGCRYRERYPPVDGTLVSHDVSPGFGKRYDVKPNEPFQVAMWLERNGERVKVPGASFGLALVSCTGPPDQDADGDGFFLDESLDRSDCRFLSFPGPAKGFIRPLENDR